MRRSRIEAAETRERILSTASQLFLNEGLGAVGMREIMGALNLTQGGFYRHFESKEQLIAEANRTAADRIFAMLEHQIAGKSRASALDIIVSTYLGQARDKENTFRCPLAMIGAELSHCDQDVRSAAMDTYRRFVQLIADYLPVDAKPLAGSIICMLVGSVTLSQVAPDRATAESILANAKTSIGKLVASI